MTIRRETKVYRTNDAGALVAEMVPVMTASEVVGIAGPRYSCFDLPGEKVRCTMIDGRVIAVCERP